MKHLWWTKILVAFVALALVASFALVPAVVSAEDSIEFTYVGEATAGLSLVGQGHSPDYSAKLYVKDGAVDWAEVSIPVNIALKDITELKFWEYIGAYAPNGYKVQVVLGIDLDGEDGFESDLAAWHRASIAGDADAKTAALAGDSFISLEQPEGSNPPTGWTFVDSLNEARCWEPIGAIAYLPFADFLAALPGDSGIGKDSIVREVILQIGGSGSWMDETAFVDDITINGVVYDFESGATVEVATEVVKDIIQISIDPTSFNFGELRQGQCAVPEPITITNNSNMDIVVSASTESLFYVKSLEIGTDTGSWSFVDSWSANIDEDCKLLTNLKVCVPSSWNAGTETGVIVFWAEQAE